jgi:hypothetical protein
VRKWAGVFAVAGAVWMILVLWVGSLALARVSNYPGTVAVRWIQFRGIAPLRTIIWAFNIWLVLTSAIAWVAAGLILRTVLRRLSARGNSQLSIAS